MEILFCIKNKFIKKVMNYTETINWLFNQLPMYQTQGASAYKEDLTNTHIIIKYFKIQKKFNCIHSRCRY
jgi:dihydrofolate synthase/folylpolyglutamate synthase